MALILVQGWRQGIGQYLYKDSKTFEQTMEGYGHLDALYVAPGSENGISRNIMWNFVDISKLNSVTFFKGNVSKLCEMEELRQKPECILYVIESEMSEQTEEEVLGQVKEYCPQITESDLIGRYGMANVYHLYGK